MNRSDFIYLRQLLHDRCANVLEDGKEYLVEARLEPLVRREKMKSIADLFSKIRAQPFNGLREQVVSAMLTSETSFFRDQLPFVSLRTKIIPQLIERRAAERTLHIWSAACSSGQEPYSIAMLLREHFPRLEGWQVHILASDLSEDMIARAKIGRYNQFEINRGLPAALMIRYFHQIGLDWEIHDNIRTMIEFRRINLADALPPLPMLDLIFLRNVLIYFDVEGKKMVFGKMARLLRPDGFMALGGAETTFGIDDAFERINYDQAGFYRLVDRP